MYEHRSGGRAEDDPIDWEAWRRRLVQALDFRIAEPRLRDLFAPGGRFQDPSMAPTTDIASAEAATLAFCPDFHQDLTSFATATTGPCSSGWARAPSSACPTGAGKARP